MTFELPTNYSNGTIVNSTGKFFMDYPAHIISNWGAGLVLLIWMAVFAVGSYMGSKRALLSASFITTIFSIYFSVRGWLNPAITIILVLITIITAIGVKGEGSY
jgi:hypothetical protein